MRGVIGMISVLWKGFVVKGLQAALMKSKVYRKDGGEIEFSVALEVLVGCPGGLAGLEGRIQPGIEVWGCTSS